MYGTIAPILDKYGGTHTAGLNNNIMKAISGYDNIRHKVLDTNNEINENINKIKTNLDKNNVKFNFA